MKNAREGEGYATRCKVCIAPVLMDCEREESDREWSQERVCINEGSRRSGEVEEPWWRSPGLLAGPDGP